MRLRWTAGASAVVLACGAARAVYAAPRPHYGGDLRIEMRASLKDPDPSAPADDSGVLEARAQLVPLVFETLVRLDDRGDPKPWLATSWTHDSEHKRWVFSARANVTFHDGSKWSPPDGVIMAPDDRPIEQILRDLARPRNAIVSRAADGSLAGTGPFRISEWGPGKSARLAAHEAYWGGRPYLDSVVIQMGRSYAEQATDFQTGRADVVEIAARDLRSPRPGGAATFSTRPMETLALQFEPGRVPDRMREAVALSIDRTAIRDVLLQRQGEASGALLPRWLTGYSFLFPSARNVARAQELVASSGGATIAFAYDRQDPVLRPVAERIAVNASEASIALRNSSSGSAALRLARLPITVNDPWVALGDLAGLLKIALPENPANPYEAERSLLGGFQVIPIVQIPRAWMMSSRVRNWPNLPDVWLDAALPSEPAQ
jgi:peptide/nickel transport system substrate-binding protein